jgi:proteic killer suppression protein
MPGVHKHIKNRFTSLCWTSLTRRLLCGRYAPSPLLSSNLIVTLHVIILGRYYLTMIVSFKCSDTEALSNGRRIRRFVNFERIALRKLRPLQVAEILSDLRVPLGNRLEVLKGNRIGQHSIRINDQFRICFRWSKAGAANVEIVDYH